MPIYGYRCESCGREIDVMHAIDGLGPTTCEVCGGSMRKTLSTPAIHFKGSGWAKKDASAATSSGKVAATTAGEPGGGTREGSAGADGGAGGDAPADGATQASGGSDKGTQATPAVGSGSPGSGPAAGTSGARSAKGRGGRPDTQA